MKNLRTRVIIIVTIIRESDLLSLASWSLDLVEDLLPFLAPKKMVASMGAEQEMEGPLIVMSFVSYVILKQLDSEHYHEPSEEHCYPFSIPLHDFKLNIISSKYLLSIN